MLESLSAPYPFVDTFNPFHHLFHHLENFSLFSFLTSGSFHSELRLYLFIQYIFYTKLYRVEHSNQEKKLFHFSQQSYLMVITSDIFSYIIGATIR